MPACLCPNTLPPKQLKRRKRRKTTQWRLPSLEKEYKLLMSRKKKHRKNSKKVTNLANIANEPSQLKTASLL